MRFEGEQPRGLEDRFTYAKEGAERKRGAEKRECDVEVGRLYERKAFEKRVLTHFVGDARAEVERACGQACDWYDVQRAVRAVEKDGWMPTLEDVHREGYPAAAAAIAYKFGGREEVSLLLRCPRSTLS